MLHAKPSAPSPLSIDRETRIQRLLEQLRPAAEQALRQMAETLVDVPDAQLLGATEFALRDAALALAATAQHAGLDGRKKGGTTAPASSAPAAPPTPSSSTTCPAPS